MKKVCVFTGTRAEYGLLKPVIQKIQNDSDLQLCLVVTGMHASEKYGNTYKEIESDGFHIDYMVDMQLGDDSPYGIAVSMGKECVGLGEAYADARPDMLILLGDRYELVIAAVAAVVFEIPIAHIHGGESTAGAIDDSFRHAISKMSTLHFPSTAEYAKRVIQMGENPESVFTVGALGIENIEKVDLYSRETLAEKFGGHFVDDYVMITYHPVTLEHGSAESQFKALLQALSSFPDYKFIFTYANADAEGNTINTLIESYVSEHPSTSTAFKSMGQTGYLSALKYCSLVLGNSSSGIIEAPSFHIPTVNIGNRQQGRIQANTVINCGYTSEEIREAIQIALSSSFMEVCKYASNPYRGQNPSEKIVSEIKKYLFGNNGVKKHSMM